ncbi:AlpA family phage regulatory protein [Marinomonas dokdonensis]
MNTITHKLSKPSASAADFRLPDVKTKTGYGRSTIYALMETVWCKWLHFG